MGEWVHALELPWHYLFVWIGMTVPTVYLAFSLLGVGNGVRYCLVNRKEMSKNNNKGWIFLALFLILTIPFLYVIIVRPVLYNGWRHFYFMYSIIATCAVIGIHGFAQEKLSNIIKGIGAFSLVASLALTGGWILKNHPHEYVYYNKWIREYAADNFQRDYWFVTEQEAMQYILDNDERTWIPIFSYQGYSWMFDGTEDARFWQTTSREAAEYIIADEERFIEEYLFTKVHSVTVDGMDIRNVYKRTYDSFKRMVLQIGGEQQEYELNGVTWEKSVSGETTVYQGTFTEVMPTDLFAILVSDAKLLEAQQIEVYVSGDEETWHNMKDFPRFERVDTRLSAECSVHDLKSIRIVCHGEIESDQSVEIVLCGYSANVNTMDVSNPVIKNATTNVTTDTPIRFAMDADGGTRWTTPAQQAGMHVVLELKEEMEISGVQLELKESPWDYPRNLQISVSMDGENWERLDTVTDNNEIFRFEPNVCRYLKLELGETQEDVKSNWSIYELRLFSRIAE